jgi:hypothetical protein
MKPCLRFLVVLVLLITALAVSASPPSAFRVVSAPHNTLAVIDPASGDTIHRIAQPAGVIREMVALDNGRIVMTTTANESEFWNAATGKLERRFDNRIYAFSHDQSLAVTFTRAHSLTILNFPGLTRKTVLLAKNDWGPSALEFSADDHYLAVEFCNLYPLSDEAFQNPVFDKANYRTLVFDLLQGKQIPEVGGVLIGRFAEDSKSYFADDGREYDLVNRTWLPANPR